MSIKKFKVGSVILSLIAYQTLIACYNSFALSERLPSVDDKIPTQEKQIETLTNDGDSHLSLVKSNSKKTIRTKKKTFAEIEKEIFLLSEVQADVERSRGTSTELGLLMSTLSGQILFGEKVNNSEL